MAGNDNTQEALRIVQEHFPWVLQKKNTSGEWETFGKPIKGRTAAYDALNTKKKQDKSHEYRALPKNEADKYREGLNAAKQSPPRRRPLLALPENL